MAEYVTVVELEKTIDLDNTKFIYYSPFVFSQKVSVYNLNSYFVILFGATDVTNKIRRNILSITINFISYTSKASLVDCQGDEESYYFDIATQTIYIHLNHEYNILSYDIYAGIAIGFTNTGVKYYNDIEYKPKILAIPELDVNITPNIYNLMAFLGGSFSFDNLPDDLNQEGIFDSSYLDPSLGNGIRILFGLSTYTYAQLLEYAKFIVESQFVGKNITNLSVIDQRKSLSVKIPNTFFNITDYPDIETSIINKPIPLAFGIKYGVPGICVDGQAAGAKTFKVPQIDILFNVWVKQPNGIWERVTPTGIVDATGLITIAEADCYEDGDDEKTLLSVKVDGIFGMDANYIDPLDIIAYLNDEYMGIPYDASGYDLTECASERLLLDDCGIYIDKPIELYQVFEILQGSCAFGFFYEHSFETRTIRIDNPVRDIVRTIEAVELLNIGEYEILSDDFFTDAIIKYKPDISDKQSGQIENTDYLDNVKRKYGKEIRAEVQLQTVEEQTAIDRAVILLEDMQEARFRISFSIAGIAGFSLRVGDIISVDFNQYYRYHGRDITITHKKDRAFLGVQRCKIINIGPVLESGIIRLTVRRCYDSDAVTRIINNKSYFYDHMLYYDSGYFLTYWISYAGSGEITSVIDGTDKEIKIGNNAGDDSRWLIYNKNIPLDDTALYEVRAIVKKTNGTGLCYIGIAGIDADGTTFITTTGAGLATGVQHYFALAGVNIGSDWTEYKGYFQGTAAAGNGGQHNDIFDPGTVHEDAVYIRPMIFVNQAAAAGETHIKEFQIRKITEV